jgi:hypothetical protein
LFIFVAKKEKGYIMFYTRCSYDGQHTKDLKRMHGRGIFTFANGNKYVGTFHDGAFHGQGIIFFTDANGGGQYRGVWEAGKCLSGEYIFSDGLPFEESGWGHCTTEDRRMWRERLAFISPSEPLAPLATGTTITPDYATSDGIPAAFANGKPRGARDVTADFWTKAPAPRPEHEGVIDPLKEPDMAQQIAVACPRH